MRMTKKSEYALLALLYLARVKSEQPAALKDISTHCDIPLKYLEQLVSILKHSRLVRARRGSMGGYYLARPPEDISMAEIIRLMDGALAPVESVSKYFFSHTPLEREPGIIEVLRDIRDYISQRLESITLADLM